MDHPHTSPESLAAPDPGSPAGSRRFRLTPGFAIGLILLQSLLYGFGDPISKTAFDTIPVYTLLSTRYIIALALMLLFAGKRIIAGLRHARVRDWLASSLCLSAAYLVGNVAIMLTAATSVAFLRSLSTVMTPLLALVLFHQRYSKRHIPIQLAVLLGLYLLCGRGGLSGFGLGEVLALLTALLLAGSLVLGQRSLHWVDPVTLSALQTAASAVMGTACAFLFDGGWTPLSAATPQVWLIIAYLAAGCTVAGYLLQNVALTAIPDRTAALAQSVCPVMTAAFSYLLLGERLSLPGWVGAAIIVTCVAMESRLPPETGGGSETAQPPGIAAK